MRRLALLLVLFALAGCTTERVGGDPAQPTSPRPVDLRVPLDLARVTPAGAASPAASTLPGPGGVALALEAPFMTITRLDDARTHYLEDARTWGVAIRMTPADARVFGDWTTGHVGEQVAVVADGEVVSAPQISAAITTGDIVISAQFTKEDARDLLKRITGS